MKAGSELVTAIFRVSFPTWTPNRKIICRGVYVRLKGGISRGAALRKIKALVEEHSPADSKIEFQFWCDEVVSSAGQPLEIEA